MSKLLPLVLVLGVGNWTGSLLCMSTVPLVVLGVLIVVSGDPQHEVLGLVATALSTLGGAFGHSMSVGLEGEQISWIAWVCFDVAI